MENKKLNAKAVKNFLSNNAIIILIFILALFVGFVADNFWKPANFKNLVVNVSPRFIIACGVSGCLITKGTDLSAGRQVGLSACLAAMMLQSVDYAARALPWMPDLPWFVALLLVILIMAVFGAINGCVIAFLKVPPFIATLGMQTIVYGLCSVVTGNDPLGGFKSSYSQVALGSLGPIPYLAIFALAGCAARVVLYGDMAALLVHLDRKERLYPLLEELERLSRLSQSYLGLRLTTGVGLVCQGPEELNRSAAGARSALDYRVLVGGGRVIYIGDQEPQSAAAPSFEEEDQRALSAAVKLGTREQAESAVRELMERLRQAGLSLSKCDLFLLEVVTCLVRLTRSGGLPVEEVFGEGFTGTVSVSGFSSLEELGDWLAERCGRLHDLLGRRRSDSAWQMVERAKDYIAGHYTDEQLSVETLCAHIHLSPTYFSTLFKREVGMSFTAYVTQVRMEEAARLLRETDEKTYRIAEATGYSDPNYFSYVFKRHFGLSPSKFRAGQKS